VPGLQLGVQPSGRAHQVYDWYRAGQHHDLQQEGQEPSRQSGSLLSRSESAAVFMCMCEPVFVAASESVAVCMSVSEPVFVSVSEPVAVSMSEPCGCTCLCLHATECCAADSASCHPDLDFLLYAQDCHNQAVCYMPELHNMLQISQVDCKVL